MHSKKEIFNVPVRILLRPGELGIMEEESVLFETKAYRIFGGAGTRVGGISFGGGASESHQRLRKIDSGILVLTTERLVFDGAHENRSLELTAILSANPWSDAIEISPTGTRKSQIYKVQDPLAWVQIIQNIVAGNIEIVNRVPINDKIVANHELENDIPSSTKNLSAEVPNTGGLFEGVAKSVAHSLGRRLGRQIARGVLGTFFGSRKRGKKW